MFTLFRNAAAELREWLEFHKLVGVEHFFLYDHQSDDDSRRVLAPYVAAGEVTLRDWTGSEFLHEIQIRALRHCVRSVRGETEWLAFFDVDEFLFPRRADSLLAVLDRLPPWCSGVSVPWTLFGPSGWRRRAPGLVCESYLRRPERDYALHRAVKSIYRPGRIVRFGGYAAHRARCVPPTRIERDELQLNHYWTRSEDALRERMKHRRGVVRDSLHHYGISAERAGWEELLLDRIRAEYRVEDREILRFLPALRARLADGPGSARPVSAGVDRRAAPERGDPGR